MIFGSVALVFSMLLVSCSAPVDGGVLEDASDGHSTWCAPISDYPDVAFGMPLDFDEGAPVKIRSISMENDQNLQLGELRLVDLGRFEGAGLVAYPPDDAFPEEWKASRPAMGATIVAGEYADLVAQVVYAGAGTGKFDELLVRYEQDGVIYEAHSHVGLVMSTGPCSE